MINVLIYEKNICKCKEIINYISTLNFNINIYTIANSDNEILALINKFDFDLLIIDIYSVSEYESKKFHVLSNKLCNSNIPTIILSKKFNIHAYLLPEHIYILNDYNLLNNTLYSILLLQSQQIESINSRIYKELEYLAFNINHIGTFYLAEVITYIYFNHNTINNLTKFVYPEISQKYSISMNTLKCDIFQSTLHSYINCEQNKLEKYLRRSCIEKPSTKNYIYSILEHLKLGTL